MLLYADVGEAWLMLMGQGEPVAVGSCVWDEEDEVGAVIEGAARKLLQDNGDGVQRVWGAGAGDMAWSEELAGCLGAPCSILDPLAAVVYFASVAQSLSEFICATQSHKARCLSVLQWFAGLQHVVDPSPRWSSRAQFDKDLAL